MPGRVPPISGASVPSIQPASWADFEAGYESFVERFHDHFDHHQRPSQVANAIYHKSRYLELISFGWLGNVLDVGNDKPFLAYYLAKFNPKAVFHTVSFEIPQSPASLYELDIEAEALPFADASFDEAIMTEVIEHMWRDPSMAISEIARCLKRGGRLFLTTPNACERHAITCILWQAHPNQRSQYYSTLESGHVHLWTVNELREILEVHGFEVPDVRTKDYAGYTKDTPIIDELIKKVSPYADLMGETIVIEAIKRRVVEGPQYPHRIYPDGVPVQFAGALEAFASRRRGMGR
jgi:SAM-dependent methyltransferase